MEQSSRHVNRSPAETANVLSRLFFCWLNPLMWKGYKSKLDQDDMYNVLNEDRTELLCDKLETEWEKELAKSKEGKSPCLRNALARTFGFKLACMGIIVLLEEVTKVIQPLLLGGLIRYFDDSGRVSTQQAYLYAMGMTACAAFLALTHHPYFFLVQKIGMTIRVACSALIYKKSLRLGHNAFQKTTTGQIVNLLTNDVTRFDLALLFLHFLWVGPLQALAIFTILWVLLGPSSLVGFVVLACLIPIQSSMGRLFAKLRRSVATQTDERVKVVNEILMGIRVIKMYCWEKMFSKLNAKIRGRGQVLYSDPYGSNDCLGNVAPWLYELKHVTSVAHYRSLVMSTTIFGYHLTVFCAVIAHALLSPPLEARHVFPLIALYSVMRGTLFSHVTMAFQFGNEGLVSVIRVQEFLTLEELQDTSSILYSTPSDPAESKVIALGMSAAWQQDQQSNTIDKISFELSSGQLLTVIGPIGAGKSSLLMALLAELPLSSGSGKIHGSVAYTAQQAWVFSASVRQNILFGRPYDAILYRRVIEAAALEPDFAMFAFGDQTLVGERGVSLSGGQKARIGLARALYIDADVYLLDDPLSAVDPAVSRHLFDKCICGFLKDKIRILVTHQLQYIEHADKMLILDEGNVIGTGSYEELVKQGVDFHSLLHHSVEDENLEESSMPTSPNILSLENGGNAVVSKSLNINSVLDEPVRKSLTQSLRNLNHTNKQHNQLLLPSRTRHKHKSDGNLSRVKGASLVKLSSLENLQNPIQSMMSLDSINEPLDNPVATQDEESRDEGSVGVMTYVRYFWAGGGVLGIVLFFTLNIGAQSCYIATDWWLSYWTEQEKHRSEAMLEYNTRMDNFTSLNSTDTVSEPTMPDVSPVPVNKYMYIYASLVVGVFILGFLRAILMFRLMVRCSQQLHLAMFHAVIRSPIIFFDTNPIGRILNRFSKDTGLMDEQLPITMYDFVQCSLAVLGTIFVVGVINPYVFIPTIPLVIMFMVVRKVFLETSRDVKRIESTARSPVFSHLSTTLNGIHTIRSLQAQKSFISDFFVYQDLHTEAWFMFLAINRWFAVRLDWLCVMFIGATAFLCVLMADNLSGGLVGLTMTYAIGLMGLFQWAVRQSAEIENQMVSVERVLEYTKLPAEAELDKDNSLSEDWPEHGGICAQNASFQYAEDQSPVLSQVNFNIKPKEKIGIVGRTGAGKSSMVAMLFRLAEPHGSICIDGVDSKSLGLHQLRGCMSIIPQDPVLFSGTVRRNLDPFNSYTDDEIWIALQEVEIGGVIKDLPEGLLAPISEGGGNFSVGQRQLLCLCRAILRRNKILVIDEATANVDPRTDSLIQKTLRETFKDCTVLTIAHRLNTIVDSDRIMVLDKGHIIEFDAPYVLLQNHNSKFSSMLNETGAAQSEQLYAIAKETYNEKQVNANHGKNTQEYHNGGGIRQEYVSADNEETESATEKHLLV